jgi:hypothetical protein
MTTKLLHFEPLNTISIDLWYVTLYFAPLKQSQPVPRDPLLSARLFMPATSSSSVKRDIPVVAECTSRCLDYMALKS